ncbi:J domain-containing protein [Novosphingobium mangrovi (ex Hu et al. 2023)]|uniref:J domain-containing protein n=1 Tax=Novosphingobium mangrovi (ex Hu et al. 2023) TaxID=2930094 RepID=A0ABT0ADQ4_9SPHN|nr:J domain-containing protein [Novosphingobium mangrovi (ex Hu et al. 2023)]MCJ1961289.1 J domain-containing protein [Novosphingobium mangrovi (ex Hu et al. 2023)]
MKFLWIIVLAAIAWRMVLGRWPWQTLGISHWPDSPPKRRTFAQRQAQELLGLKEGASRKQILDAHRRHVALVHPDRGGSSEEVHAANAARDTLLSALGGADAEDTER